MTQRITLREEVASRTRAIYSKHVLLLQLVRNGFPCLLETLRSVSVTLMLWLQVSVYFQTYRFLGRVAVLLSPCRAMGRILTRDQDTGS